VSDYAVDAMAWAVGTGLINGRTETTLCPGDPMTRAELATLILRFYDMTK
ncbi:MAG: S-layer homology domain-containing protein, partial [Firmicutes bacterium]|nr:S-layer homology domain-containing protein [Bacillota bacterium]